MGFIPIYSLAVYLVGRAYFLQIPNHNHSTLRCISIVVKGIVNCGKKSKKWEMNNVPTYKNT